KVLAKRIKELEQQMLAKARDLQFEQAAKIRDEMMRLKEQLLVQQV
ncbi:MAG: UvrB/UvrC motif-containing protein, partial [Pseudomonadales bacterium]|nr:UvrB/UvrC motif-containing protein [Pseudomonadales bacterium]